MSCSHPKRVCRVAVLAGASLLSACGHGPDRPRLEDANVLLIVVDTLGANQLAAYRAGAARTPSIDALAAEGVRFDRAYSAAPWTQPAVASLFTGQMPSRHGVRRIRDVLAEGHTTLAELLRERGYATRGVISHSLLAAGLGYAQGFDAWDESAVGGHDAITSEQVTDRAIADLEDLAGTRFFLFAHYFDPHFYYHHHPAFDRSSAYDGPLTAVPDIWDILAMRPELTPADIAFLEARHREEIEFTDRQVGRLLARLAELELAGDTLVVLVGDHGEEFMGHGWIGHTRTLYQELIHVPFIVRWPGEVRPAAVHQPVSTADLLPTLMTLSGTPVESAAWDGEFLGALFGSRPDANREVVAEVAFVPPSDRQREKLAVKTTLVGERYKVIHDRITDAWELYDLARDPDEHEDLTGAEPEVFRRMARDLVAWESRPLPEEAPHGPPSLELTPEEYRALRSLGYVD